VLEAALHLKPAQRGRRRSAKEHRNTLASIATSSADDLIIEQSMNKFWSSGRCRSAGGASMKLQCKKKRYRTQSKLAHSQS